MLRPSIACSKLVQIALSSYPTLRDTAPHPKCFNRCKLGPTSSVPDGQGLNVSALGYSPVSGTPIVKFSAAAMAIPSPAPATTSSGLWAPRYTRATLLATASP